MPIDSTLGTDWLESETVDIGSGGIPPLRDLIIHELGYWGGECVYVCGGVWRSQKSHVDSLWYRIAAPDSCAAQGSVELDIILFPDAISQTQQSLRGCSNSKGLQDLTPPHPPKPLGVDEFVRAVCQETKSFVSSFVPGVSPGFPISYLKKILNRNK